MNSQEYWNDSIDQAIHIASACRSNHVTQKDSQGLLLSDLCNVLYQKWYTRSTLNKECPPLPQLHWAEVFRSVHQGSSRFEKGWRVFRVSSAGRVLAGRGDEERLLCVGDYICPDRPGLPAVPGAQIEVIARRDSSREQPGFWITYSSSWNFGGPALLRLYWNIVPVGAVRLVRLITEKIADTIPYSFKAPVDGMGYQRADAAVLYIESKSYDRLLPVFHVIHAEIKEYLFPHVPAFTKKLAPGLGLAEDPLEKSESFGMNRCRLLAEGFVTAKTIGVHDISRIRPLLQDALNRAGIDPVRPYLNPGSLNDYIW